MVNIPGIYAALRMVARACLELFLHERTGHLLYCTTIFFGSALALVFSLKISLFVDFKRIWAGLFRVTSPVQF